MFLATPLDTETARVAALRAFQVLDTPPEPAFDRLTGLAAQIFGVPAALVSLVDEERQWFKSCYGLSPFTRLDRSAAFCAHAILEHGVFVVEDATRDPRFHDHPQVLAEGGIRFYAGAPLTIRGGLNIGTLCLVDFKPRTFSAEQRELLANLAGCVVDTLDARESRRQLATQIVHREQVEGQLQAIIDNTTSVIYLKDCEGQYLMVNQRFAQIFGETRENLVGRTDECLHSQEVLHKIRLNDLQVQTKGEPLEFEETIQQEDGLHTYISVKYPMRDRQGKIYGICGISTDITDRAVAEQTLREAKEEAERANAAKGDFLSRMSHELRTPLNAILGFGQLLQRRVPDEWHREKTDFIVDAGYRLLAMINDVLDLTRLEAGQTALSLQPVALGSLLEECRAVASVEAARRSIEIEITPATEETATVIADRERLRQVLLNLLNNATKYNRIDGRIFLSLERRGDQVAVHCRDTGVGIHPNKMARLFVPFDRLEAGQGEAAGIGVGLALSRQLTELMGGTLTVASAPGEGSTFTVNLAAADAFHRNDAAPAPVVTPEEEAPPRLRQTVLYAEDNAFNLSLMEEIAEAHGGVELVSVTCGSEVLRQARAIRPKLILLDLHLPKIAGDQILREIRADAELRAIPVVMVSANAMKSHIERLLREGANDYMTKPIEVTRALDLFDHYLPS